MIRLGIFIALSLLLLVFTLKRPHRYRFQRFFAFESILGLVLMNALVWFRAPLSTIQLVSWSFLAGSLLLAIHGFWMLRAAGAPEKDIENTTQLVTIGAYRYVRHPIYCSLLLGGVGMFLKRPVFLGSLLLAALVIFVFATAKVEEGENLRRFGEPYRRYMRRTKMFVPYLI